MKIKDCIYRFISVPDICIPFINHPIFQSLRRKRQLGMAHYLYPSAVHTRFEHSLGVMHLAGVVAKQLKLSKRNTELVQLAGS